MSVLHNSPLLGKQYKCLNNNGYIFTVGRVVQSPRFGLLLCDKADIKTAYYAEQCEPLSHNEVNEAQPLYELGIRSHDRNWLQALLEQLINDKQQVGIGMHSSGGCTIVEPFKQGVTAGYMYYCYDADNIPSNTHESLCQTIFRTFDQAQTAYGARMDELIAEHNENFPDALWNEDDNVCYGDVITIWSDSPVYTKQNDYFISELCDAPLSDKISTTLPQLVVTLTRMLSM